MFKLCICQPNKGRILSNYIPEIWKFRWYYVFGCAAAVCATARQRFTGHNFLTNNQIHIRHGHWGPRLLETLWFLASIGLTKWPLAAILYKNSQQACGISNFVINSPAAILKYIFKKRCVLIWNGEKCDRKWFSVIEDYPNRTSKMAAGGSKVIFGHPKWPPGVILRTGI